MKQMTSKPRTPFPSPLAGEGGERGGNPSASRVRGSLRMSKRRSPPHPVLAFGSDHPLSRGEREKSAVLLTMRPRG